MTRPRKGSGKDQTDVQTLKDVVCILFPSPLFCDCLARLI